MYLEFSRHLSKLNLTSISCQKQMLLDRGLPTVKEWAEMLETHSEWGLSLDHEPADPRSDGDMKDGYLAVLTKM